MATPNTDYRSFLKAELEARCKRNSRYSLRSFAKVVGLSPSVLSRVIRGQKTISPERAQVICDRLQLTRAQAEQFCLMVQLEAARSEEFKVVLAERLQSLAGGESESKDLSVDVFRSISDWYPLALFEALLIPSLKKTPAALAKFLGIAPIEAANALERLERLELIRRKASGAYERLGPNIIFRSKMPSEAIRNYYRSVLEKVLDAVNNQTPQEKTVGAEVFVFNKVSLEQARALTDRYLKGLQSLSKDSPEPTDVYQAFAIFCRLNPKIPPTKTRGEK